MIKLPSIKSLLINIGSEAKRFPFVVSSSVLLAGTLIYMTHEGWDFKEHDFFWGKLSMCCALGLSFFFATALLSEAKGHSLKQKMIVQAITLAIILIYYFTIEKYEEFNLESFTRYTLYIIAAHLFVAFAAFTGANRINSFWQFNKTLSLRFLLSMLYVSVLYGGIALAFFLIDDLLHFKIEYTKYLYVWYILSAIVNTFIFLAGIPKDLLALEGNNSYPKGLKAFTQFVLLPLVTLYMLILYAYFAKIIIQWSLPKGYVSYLVISFSVMGILSLLLIYPLRDNEENKWIKIFSRWFYVALYPLIILLGVSIYHRIFQYGITEHRYFILVLAGWLVFIGTYFLLTKKENIKIIPITLCLFSILTSAGPWGAFSISKHSQKNRLEKILLNNGILINGKITKAHKIVNDSVRKNISSIVRYLDESHSIEMLQPWLTINLDSIHNSKWGYSYKADSVLAMMGVSSQYYGRYASSGGGFILQLKDRYNETPIDIKGFDYYFDFTYDNYQSDTAALDTTKNYRYMIIGTDSVCFIPCKAPCKFALVKNKKNIADIDLNGFITDLHNQLDSIGDYDIYVPSDKFSYKKTATDSIVYCFCFKSIEVEKVSNNYRIQSLQAAILTKHQ